MSPEVETVEDRAAANLWEFFAGLHWWRRQVAIHAGFYRFIADATAKASEKPGRSPDDPLAAAIAGAPEAQGGVTLEGDEWLKNALMTTAKFQPGASMSTSSLYQAVRRAKLCPKQDTAKKVSKAALELKDAGLLEEVADGVKKPGPQVQTYKKATWAQIEARDDAKSLCARLQLGRGDFE